MKDGKGGEGFLQRALTELNSTELNLISPPCNTEVEVLDDGGLQLVELSPIAPWLADPRQPVELQKGEVKVGLLYYLFSTFSTEFMIYNISLFIQITKQNHNRYSTFIS